MLRDRYAVITGGSDGIGLAIATKFAQKGANLLLLARNEDRLLKVQKELSSSSGQIEVLPADLSDLSALEKVAQGVLEIFPEVDVLVNNAGIARFVPFEQMDLECLDLHLDLNVRSSYILTQALFASIKKRKGNILNISSYFSDRMLPGRESTAYSLSKGAINSFTKSLAFEVGKFGVRVNAIAPGSVATSLLRHNYEQLSQEGKRQFDDLVATAYPLQKIGEPQDIAEMALFLVSDRAKWITGSIVGVDGGLRTS